MTDTRDHSSGDQGHHPQHSTASDTAGSHLAHWPPPQRGLEVKPVLAKHHPPVPAEPAEHAKPHGRVLTRSVFKEDDE